MIEDDITYGDADKDNDIKRKCHPSISGHVP